MEQQNKSFKCDYSWCQITIGLCEIKTKSGLVLGKWCDKHYDDVLQFLLEDKYVIYEQRRYKDGHIANTMRRVNYHGEF